MSAIEAIVRTDRGELLALLSTMRTQEKTVICKTERETSPGLDLLSSWAWISQPLKL